MIKKHCPDLSDKANAQLQCVPGAIACWKRYCDIGDLEVRLFSLTCDPPCDVVSERDDSGYE
jgi:hypothetical protein